MSSTPTGAVSADLQKYMPWVVLILFSIVESKIVHYSSMAYLPLTFLASFSIYHIIQGRFNFSRWIKVGILSIAALFCLPIFIMPFLAQQIDRFKDLIDDPFAQGNLKNK